MQDKDDALCNKAEYLTQKLHYAYANKKNIIFLSPAGCL